jgi:hypothetical protein
MCNWRRLAIFFLGSKSRADYPSKFQELDKRGKNPIVFPRHKKEESGKAAHNFRYTLPHILEDIKDESWYHATFLPNRRQDIPNAIAVSKC